MLDMQKDQRVKRKRHEFEKNNYKQKLFKLTDFSEKETPHSHSFVFAICFNKIKLPKWTTKAVQISKISAKSFDKTHAKSIQNINKTLCFFYSCLFYTLIQYLN